MTARAAAVRRGEFLEYITIGYNSLEAVIALVAGFIAGSIALVGFGFDSVIEVTSGAALLWSLRRDSKGADAAALRVVGACFLVLAGYVTYESVETLLARQAPERSIPGILIAAASVVIMPLLARAKRHVAAQLGSAAMEADARQTDFCLYLSVILLAGLALNAVAGWWWADPVAALIMVPIIAREGYTAVRGKSCGCHGACTNA